MRLGRSLALPFDTRIQPYGGFYPPLSASNLSPLRGSFVGIGEVVPRGHAAAGGHHIPLAGCLDSHTPTPVLCTGRAGIRFVHRPDLESGSRL